MLEPVPMLRIKALLLARDERTALQSLGELGMLHLIPAEAAPPGTAVGTWERLLERVQGLRLALGPFSRPPEPMEDPEGALQAMETRAQALAERRTELRALREEAMEQAARIGAFRGLGIPLDRIGQGSFLHLALGTLPEAQLDELRREMEGRAFLLALPPCRGRHPLLAMGHTGCGLERLGERGFQAEGLPREGTLDAFIEELDLRVGRLAREEARLEAEFQAFSEESAGPLAGLEARARLEKGLLEAGEHCPRTARTLLLQGWVPAADAPRLAERLGEASGGACVLETEAPGVDEEAPVLLRPSPLLRPFERLVSGYGLPRYRELSPTPFVALSYLLMFGMMFGDVGHGLVLALLGLLAWRKWRDASLLLLGGGLSSALFGAVYGSCFGLARFKHLALWHDPLEGDPIQLMGLAIGLGVLMISLGLLLNILNRIRRHDVEGALMGRFGLAGILFYWGALALLWKGPLPWPIGALLLLPILAWVFHARHGGLTDALVEAFETLLVYLANTISFVRLAAYAMSHAALLVATFLMADSLAPPLSWVVIILGNLAAILLEGVIASVQALRLEYYEFFGKFFSGAGRPFQPFRLDVKEGET